MKLLVKSLLAVFLFLAFSMSVKAQDDILSKVKWNMSGDELMSAFKDQGISSYTYSDNDDNNNDDDNDNDDNNNRSGYRISSYSMDGNNYSVRFSMNRGKLKEVRFSLGKSSASLDIFNSWDKKLYAKFGSPVHNNDFSGYGRTENERAYENSDIHVELHYFEGNGRRALDITYSREN